MTKLFLATLRTTFHAEDEVEARLVANEIEEAASTVLDEEDVLELTQVIPYDVTSAVEPTELINQMRLVRDMLIKTRIIQCFEEAQAIDKIAWILEHRAEDTFDLSGYDHTAFFERSEKLLGRKNANDING